MLEFEDQLYIPLHDLGLWTIVGHGGLQITDAKGEPLLFKSQDAARNHCIEHFSHDPHNNARTRAEWDYWQEEQIQDTLF